MMLRHSIFRSVVVLASAAVDHLHERVDVVVRDREQAARPVIFEGPTQHAHAGGGERRRNRIAGVALVRLTFECEGQRPRAIDPFVRL